MSTRRRLIGPETYELVFGMVYVGMATNLLLVVACLPAVVVLVGTELAVTWPVLVVTAPLLGPALIAAFAVFDEFGSQGRTTPVRTFLRAWRRYLRRGLAIGASATAVALVLVVDVVFFWDMTAGALVIPILVVLTAGVLVTFVLALAASVHQPGDRLRTVVASALFLGARRWYLGVGIVVVLVLLGSLVTVRPALGLGFAAAPLLYAIWGAAGLALRPVPRAVRPE